MAALSGRIALITGASRGIGAAVAKRFAAEGAQLILVSRDVKGLEATDDAVRKAGGTATLVQMDVTDTAKMEALAQNVAQRFGKLDVLVGNAGVLNELTPMQDTDIAAWDKVMKVNLTANMNLIRCFHPLLLQSAAGRAMFVSSGVADAVLAYWGAYAVSKAALDMMVGIYAAENLKGNLKINLIDPGEVWTRMYAQWCPGADAKRMNQPEDVTGIFVKLATSDCKETGKKFKV